MDRFDMLILAWLAFLALSYPVHERWKRAIAASIEKRTVRCLRVAIQRRRTV
jgi:hypothetical protein